MFEKVVLLSEIYRIFQTAIKLIIIALKELGEKNITEEIKNKITKLISECNEEERKTMFYDLYLSPVWIKELLLPTIKTVTE